MNDPEFLPPEEKHPPTKAEHPVRIEPTAISFVRVVAALIVTGLFVIPIALDASPPPLLRLLAVVSMIGFPLLVARV